MAKADERRRFRFALVKSILHCESVRKLPHDHKKLLFRWLANGWSITDTPPDTSRIASPYDDPMLAAEQEEMHERMAALPNFIPDRPVTREPSRKNGKNAKK